MARRAKPWYRSDRNAWFVWHRGRQVRLASGRENRVEAERRFYGLMAGTGIEHHDGITAGEVCDLRFAFLLAERAASTARDARWFLGQFAQRFGSVPADQLKPFEVVDWLDSRKWNKTTRRNAITHVKAAFSHAVKLGHLARSPLATLGKPSPHRRQTCTGQTDLAKILPWVRSAEYREFLIVQAETGCRPGELAKLEAKHLHEPTRSASLVGKTTARTGRRRVIRFTTRAWSIVARRASGRPCGVLFWTQSGQPWSDSARSCQHRSIRARARKAGVVLPAFCSYSIRHGWITDGLAAGVPADHLAALAGNSAREIERTYDHLIDRGDVLAGALDRVRPAG